MFPINIVKMLSDVPTFVRMAVDNIPKPAYEKFQTASIVFFAVAGVLFVFAIVLFFVLDIPYVVGDLSGKIAQKQIAELRDQNAGSRKKRFSPSPVNMDRGKLTQKVTRGFGKTGNNNSKNIPTAYLAPGKTGKNTPTDFLPPPPVFVPGMSAGTGAEPTDVLPADNAYAAGSKTDILAEKTDILPGKTDILSEKTQLLEQPAQETTPLEQPAPARPAPPRPSPARPARPAPPPATQPVAPPYAPPVVAEKFAESTVVLADAPAPLPRHRKVAEGFVITQDEVILHTQETI